MSAAPETCPICGKPKEARFTPFCSRRCAQIDLGRWLKGSYVIPGAEPGKGSDGEPGDDESSKN
ncbi:MAG TPA: DNA gyrase inhibitor YacG [Rhizomicrobium sp.]|nr:DNA gyrase inhibitor YacG [Rhizomicrobium sp.]